MKPLKKTCLLFSAFCLLLLFSGCESTSAERVAAVQSVVNQANSVSQSVNASIADVNQTIAALELLNNSNITITVESKIQIQAALAAAKTKLNALVQQKQKADDVLSRAMAVLNTIDTNDVTLETELATYGQVVTAVAPSLPASISGYAYLAGILIPVLGGLVTKLLLQINKIKQQTVEINKSKTVLTEVVTSVDTLLDPKENNGVIPPDKIADAKFVLATKQTGATSDVVHAIHDPMQNTGPS